MSENAESQPAAAAGICTAVCTGKGAEQRRLVPRRCVRAVALSLSVAVPVCRAQAPLSIEQLIAPASRWQLITAVDYGSASPTPFEERRDFGGSLTLRYGLSSRLEVNARLARQTRELRFPAGRDTSGSRRTSVGVSWLAHREKRWPALLLEARVDVTAESDGQRSSGGGGALSLTTYRSLDPVVLSMTAAWERRADFRSAGFAIDPGDRWRLEPLVSFAVNPQVTLLGGASLRYSGASRANGVTAARSMSAVAYRLGVGYAPNPGNTLFLIADGGAAREAAGLSLQWIFEF